MKKALRKIALLVMACALCIGMVISASATEAEDKVEISYSKKVWNAEESNVPGAKVSFPIGFAGMRITVGDEDLEVTAIGRWYTTGSALATRNFMIHDTEGNPVLDYGVATYATTGLEPEGFVYANIEGGVTLKANTSYYLISDYWGEYDKFYTASVMEHTDAATLDGIAILNPQTNEFEFYDALDIGWGPMDFKYMANPEDVEPEVTEPEVTEPEVTEPKVTEPKVTEPKVTEPEPTEPAATDGEAPALLGWIIAAVIVAVVVIVVVVVIVRKKKKA